MIGYGFAGLYRDILVRPPKMYYPGVLPNVSLFNAMHRNPTVTKTSLKFFAIVASVAFVYEWFPSLIFPMLGSLPLLCYMGHGNWIAYLLGSGTYGFVSHLIPLLSCLFPTNSFRECLILRWIGTTLRISNHYTPHFGPTHIRLLVLSLSAGSYIPFCTSRMPWMPRTTHRCHLELGMTPEQNITSPAS